MTYNIIHENIIVNKYVKFNLTTEKAVGKLFHAFNVNIRRLKLAV